MKSMIVVALALVAVAAAAPPVQPEHVGIVDQFNDANPEGSYRYGFVSENGIKREEEGVLKQVVDEENKPHDVVVVKGQYSYVDDQGHPQTVSYYADESGFHAEGEAIPKFRR